MNDPFESTRSLYAAQLHATRRMIDACLTGAERIDQILLQTAKDVLYDEIDNAGAISSMNTPNELLAYTRDHARPVYERLLTRNTQLLQAMLDTGNAALSAARDCTVCMAADSGNGAKIASMYPATGMVELWSRTAQQFNDMLNVAMPSASAAEPPPRRASAKGKTHTQ